MKKAKKSSSYEPTIGDVLDAVQTGFSRHEDILTRHEGIFTRQDKLLTALHEGQQNLSEQVRDIDRRLVNTQNRVEDIADNIEGVTRTSVKDKSSILDHERRIRRLEQVRK